LPQNFKKLHTRLTFRNASLVAEDCAVKAARAPIVFPHVGISISEYPSRAEKFYPLSVCVCVCVAARPRYWYTRLFDFGFN